MVQIDTGTVVCRTFIPLQVESRFYTGLPSTKFIGISGKGAAELKEKIYLISKLFPKGGITQKKIRISIYPEGVCKTVEQIELPVILSILKLAGFVRGSQSQIAAYGSVRSNGVVHQCSGIYQFAKYYQTTGKSVYIPRLPKEWLGRNSSVVSEIDSILQLTSIKMNPIHKRQSRYEAAVDRSLHTYQIDSLNGVVGAKRALQIALAGRHHLMLLGAAGVGKSKLVRASHELLPDPLESEVERFKSSYSAAGRYHDLIKRPFITVDAVHDSLVQLQGRESTNQLGKLTLADGGVLLVDELTMMNLQKVELLKQQLDLKMSIRSYMGHTIISQADFQLFATSNLCPCGKLGAEAGQCQCNEQSIKRYFKSILSPFGSRIDIHYKLTPEIYSSREQLTAKQITERIAIAIKLQSARNTGQFIWNSQQPLCEALRRFKLTARASATYERYISKGVSYREQEKVLQVARTIADLQNRDETTEESVLEAISYRPTIM